MLTDKLRFSFIGMEDQTISVLDSKEINLIMHSKTDELDEVTVVAFGKQKKESVISSITTVDVGSLQSVPTSNITTALSGQMTGLISYQSTGAPGDDNAQFFIRNAASFGNNVQSPLILIDNVEVDVRQLSRLSPDDIQSFSILKDAAATALYGARGGNGVVLITTKEGKEGKAVIDVRAESSLSMPTSRIDIADPIDYMKNFNEAILTRNPTASPRYSLDKIEKTQDPNRNPYVYPATDWLSELTKDYAVNSRLNLSISGGGKVASYYVAGSYSQDNGILKVDNINKWNTNIDFKKYTLRSNVNINVSNATKLNVRLNGAFDDYQGPIGELGARGRNTYYRALNADPVLFPAVYAPDKDFAYAPYLLFGNSDAGQYINPYARLMSGYEDNKASTLSAQLELFQDLDFVTKGLKLRFIGNVSRYGSFSLRRSYNPYYFTILNGDYDPFEDSLTPEHDGYTLFPINPESGSRFIDYEGGDQNVTSTIYGELSAIYNNTFNEKHDVGALLVSTAREYLEGNPIVSRQQLENSLPKRNLSLAGRFTYAYDGKYFTEFNFGYNGSERFASGDRFGFFPSFGVGWDISKEAFYKNLGIDPVLSKFKIRSTYGVVGNDNLGGPNRFYYLSSVNLKSSPAGYWGNDASLGLYSKPTISIANPGNPEITWEITYKANLALELGFFDNKLSVIPEIYRERRKNILQRRSNIPSTLGLPYELYSNVQENLAKGIEIAVDYKDQVGQNTWFILRGNFTYGTAEVITYDEIGTDKAPWISRIGHSPSQGFGYIAEHLFIDDNEVANSASQAALGGEVMAGDIKYVDINKDGVINQFDIAPIGYPQVPEIQYGFGGSFGYKKFDMSLFFQGQAHYSFWLDPREMAPFMPTGGGNRALLGWIADNHWTESNRDLYAQWPRLSNINSVGNDNNFQRSTYFMRTISYLRLKQLEMGYTLPKTKNVGIRAYVSGTNLLTFSKFKLWDPEMGGNGLAYPLQKVFNVGVQINFK
ncbi:SusC/RagA family TonB-linked outer membrane protein [Sunxiuqinia sp. sy24]|uniref:SusC/RagA family TonB-linked outer membrane protein n=1 Tax=Sunxiuqinia sp. sy24 TaxID=3461495 RepID=UPI0040461452